ncbi:hypothetical protein AU476_24560 [Cupriavidus sp. UYMSc13B]|nr:hypothetical protein AU476_24560 [Cupriavidus sp. UYMSc13B]
MPSLPRPSHPSPHSGPGLQLLLQFGLDHGLSGDRCLAGTGLNWQHLTAAGLIVEVEQELQLIQNLVDELGHIPGIGIEAGLRYRLATRGIWGFAMLSCATLRDALAMALRYETLWNPFTDIRLAEDGDRLVTTIDASRMPAALRTFIVDRDLGISSSFVRDLIGTTIPAQSVTLCCPEPSDVRPYEALFGVTPVFGANENRIAKNAAGYLDRPLPGANSDVARQCELQCQALLAKRRARSGLAGQLRNRLAAGPAPLPDMEMLAREFHITSRTLRRRLADEGTSFRQLQDEVLETLAEEMLAGGLKLEHVAAALGYGEASNFIRAYRRWKGVTPHQYRRQVAGGV